MPGEGLVNFISADVPDRHRLLLQELANGTGDDAADVKEEAEKVVSALGLGSVQTFDETTAGESMDSFDIFVIVGKDALGTLQ